MIIARRKLLGLGMAAVGASLVGGCARAQDAQTSYSSIEALLDASLPPAAPVAATAPAALAAKAGASERSLSFLNLHTGETLKATYYEGGAYLPDALSAVNKVMRDFRTGDVHPIDTHVLDTLSAISARLDVNEPIHVICGYRSPQTNAALAAKSGEVAKHSLHMDGQAMDIRLPGVDLANLHKAAVSLGRGGVGYYPVSNFVHVDVGRVRSWNGT
jgi:uncharacterized protein YcbK (DUF882 family)